MVRDWVPLAFYVAGGILVVAGIILILGGVAYKVKYLSGAAL